MVAFSKTVTAAGTAEPLVSTHIFVRWLFLQAKKVGGENAGMVYIGDSTVDKTTVQTIMLGVNERLQLEFAAPVDLSTLYIDAATSADGVTGFYQQ